MHLNTITKAACPQKADGLRDDLATLQALLDVIQTLKTMLGMR